MTELKLIEVPEEVFNYILENWSSRVEISHSIQKSCFCGTSNKNKIYTDNYEWIVCSEYILNYVSNVLYNKDCIKGATHWKQVRVRKQDVEHITQTYNGSYCYNYIMRIVGKYYTKEEIEEIFNTHSREYDAALKQIDRKVHIEFNKIYKFENCYYYDINGAHSYMVMSLFPKAKKDLMALYRKKNYYKKKGDMDGYNKIKALFNYFVGELCNKGYRGTYNYIVQETTKRINAATDELGGIVLYIKTDSIVVSNPVKTLNTSNELGDFKLEGSGTMYWYEEMGYNVLEYQNTKGEYEQKGTCLKQVRHLIQLRNNRVVHYTRKRVYIGEDTKGNKLYKAQAINVKQEFLK